MDKFLYNVPYPESKASGYGREVYKIYTSLPHLHTSWRSRAERDVANARIRPAGTKSPSAPCLMVSKCRECVRRAKLESSMDWVADKGRAVKVA